MQSSATFFAYRPVFLYEALRTDFGAILFSRQKVSSMGFAVAGTLTKTLLFFTIELETRKEFYEQ